jgi:hypothetical protein
MLLENSNPMKKRPRLNQPRPIRILTKRRIRKRQKLLKQVLSLIELEGGVSLTDEFFPHHSGIGLGHRSVVVPNATGLIPTPNEDGNQFIVVIRRRNTNSLLTVRGNES